MAIYYLRDDETLCLSDTPESEKVILGPSLYWYAHAQFPTKSLTKARRLADAFLDTRPAEYRTLHVERRSGGYDCYAYDNEALEARLQEEKLEGAARYFLQQFVDQMPLRIDEKRIAETVNGICLELPDENRSMPELASLDFAKVAKPFGKARGGSGLGRLGIAVVVLIAVTMLLDLGLRLQKHFAAEKAMDAIRTERSIYEIKAMIKKYETIAQKQSKLRNSVVQTLKKKLHRLECTPEEGCRGE